MKKTNHTPGPWVWRDNPAEMPFDARLVGEHGEGDEVILATFADPASDAPGDGLDPTEANARLIAAAPDLLAALDACGAALENWQTIISNKGANYTTPTEKMIAFNADELLAKARAAIRKAVGE